MFSENEIVIQCRLCKGHCEDIKRCPLKMEWPHARKSRILPVFPANWKLSGAVDCEYIPASDRYTTEELITGLNRLNSRL